MVQGHCPIPCMPLGCSLILIWKKSTISSTICNPNNSLARKIPKVKKSIVSTSPLEAAFSGWALSYISDLSFAGDGSVHFILASVIKVNDERGWFYEACKICAKKLEPDGTVLLQYKIELMIIDDSGTINNVDDARLFPTKLDSFLGNTFVFKVVVKHSR
ncbi:hypothetical protein G2W53_039497 [Senna tora]|uniref:Uncharacterized protein n=1 Tax=Senna tora TaxID=362788 RepID=A0A834W675_9FABA|nr:hypothetical protein G2W53_039497 [Senna tora]